MVGLSVVLETTKSLRVSGGAVSPKPPQVLNKTAVLITAAAAERSGFRRRSCFPETGFLEHCFLCKQKLLSGKDIYMYKGDRAFCSVECRSRQIFMDEEESLSKENCSLVAIRTTPSANPSSLSCSSSSSPAPAPSGGYSRHRRGPRNRAGGFAY